MIDETNIQLSLTLEELQTIMEALYDANSLPGTPTEGAAVLYEKLTEQFASFFNRNDPFRGLG